MISPIPTPEEKRSLIEILSNLICCSAGTNPKQDSFFISHSSVKKTGALSIKHNLNVNNENSFRSK